jgi:Rrf2 family iron-sulfur cluster assembly transcriptional regulator
MKLSTKGRYAILAMMDLAINARNKPVCLGDIAISEDISLSYLEQLMSLLRKADLVKGMRGPGGGYKLSRPTTEITMGEIIAAVDDTLTNNKGNGAEHSNNWQDVHMLWQEFSDEIYAYLNTQTLDRYIRSHFQHDYNQATTHHPEAASNI